MSNLNRRDFIKSSAVLPALALVPAFALNQEEEPKVRKSEEQILRELGVYGQGGYYFTCDMRPLAELRATRCLGFSWWNGRNVLELEHKFETRRWFTHWRTEEGDWEPIEEAFFVDDFGSTIKWHDERLKAFPNEISQMHWYVYQEAEELESLLYGWSGPLADAMRIDLILHEQTLRDLAKRYPRMDCPKYDTPIRLRIQRKDKV